MDSIANSLKPGATLDGRYTIETILGEGGFGITYKAHDNKLDCVVVIKEFLPNDFAARAADSITVQPRTNRGDDFQYGLKSFLEEARTLAKFQHANIVGVTNFVEANGSAYFVMNYAEGIDLGEWLKARTEPLDEATILEIITPILDGLAEVHKTGLMHRDIKPGNIYLRNAGGPMLIDFGAARQALGEHSKSISAIISQGYAPPEQYTTRGKQGPFTDLYAIGATLYRMIVGKAPVESSDRSHAKAEGEPDPMTPALEAGKGRVSDWLLQLTDQLLNISAKDRPQSAELVLAAIKNKTVVDAGSNSVEQKQEASDNKTRVVRSSDRFNKTASKSVSGSAPSAEAAKSKTGLIAAAIIALVAIGAGGWWFTQGNVNTGPDTQTLQTKKLGKGQSILFVESQPEDAEVYLDNILLGRTPYNNDKLPAGQHELKLVHQDTMDKAENISLSDNEITKKKYELEAARGGVSVFSTPAGAEIILNGDIATGKRTPATIKGLEVGDWEFVLKKDGYYPFAASVTILKDQTIRKDFKLEGGNLVEYNGEWLEPAEKEQRIAQAKTEATAIAQKKHEEEQVRALKRKQEEKSQQLAEQTRQESRNNIASAATAYNDKKYTGASNNSIELSAPDSAENGAVIPVTLISLGLQPGGSVTLETESGCEIFRLINDGRSVVDSFGTRIKLGSSQNIRVKNASGAVIASKKITVTIGGMGALDVEKPTRSASWSFIKEAHAAPDNGQICQLPNKPADPVGYAVENSGTRMRARQSGDSTEIKILVTHPMETGLRKDASTGQIVPAHYIQNVSIQSGSERVLVVSNASISKNPYFSVKLRGVVEGDQATMAWLDNRGQSAKSTAKVN